MSLRRQSERKHQRGGVIDFARIAESLVGVDERGIRVAKEPQSP